MRAYDTVHEIALDQHGVITAAQGREHGVNPQTLVMMAKRGRLSRLSFGVYRDLGAPTTRWTPYMAAALWPHSDPGVISHETALALMDLSDVNPAKIHLTVPKHHRTHRTPPPTFVLHRAAFAPGEVTHVEGVPVATAARTIRDCAVAAIGPAVLRQAITDAQRHGWLRAVEADRLERGLQEDGYL